MKYVYLFIEVADENDINITVCDGEPTIKFVVEKTKMSIEEAEELIESKSVWADSVDQAFMIQCYPLVQM